MKKDAIIATFCIVVLTVSVLAQPPRFPQPLPQPGAQLIVGQGYRITITQESVTIYAPEPKVGKPFVDPISNEERIIIDRREIVK